MTWDFFGPVHIVSLILAVVIIYIMYLALRKATEKTQLWVMGTISFLGILSMIYNILFLDNPLENLPLHLCSFNAIILPYAVFKKNEKICNMLLLWCLGAFVALILNNGIVELPVLGWRSFFYYFPHVFEFGIPILMFVFGLVKKNYKTIPMTVVVLLILFVMTFTANEVINGFVAEYNLLTPEGKPVVANYMFSSDPTANPLVALFYKIIPFKFFYMLLALPIVFGYLLLVYAPDIRRARKQKKQAV